MKETVDSKSVQCSFCGRSGNEVTSMVAGPDVYICDICIKTSVDILKNNLAAYNSRPKSKGLLTPSNIKKNLDILKLVNDKIISKIENKYKNLLDFLDEESYIYISSKNDVKKIKTNISGYIIVIGKIEEYKYIGI